MGRINRISLVSWPSNQSQFHCTHVQQSDGDIDGSKGICIPVFGDMGNDLIGLCTYMYSTFYVFLASFATCECWLLRRGEPMYVGFVYHVNVFVSLSTSPPGRFGMMDHARLWSFSIQHNHCTTTLAWAGRNLSPWTGSLIQPPFKLDRKSFRDRASEKGLSPLRWSRYPTPYRLNITKSPWCISETLTNPESLSPSSSIVEEAVIRRWSKQRETARTRRRALGEALGYDDPNIFKRSERLHLGSRVHIRAQLFREHRRGLKTSIWKNRSWAENGWRLILRHLSWPGKLIVQSVRRLARVVFRLEVVGACCAVSGRSWRT